MTAVSKCENQLNERSKKSVSDSVTLQIPNVPQINKVNYPTHSV